MASAAGRDVFAHMSAEGWSDGLPVVPPTPTRVAHMLTGTMRNPDEILGHCAPMYGEVTVEKVAINSVLAGCARQHLRLVLAAVEAMLTDEFNVHGVHATTMGATPAVIVHGPARHEAGLAIEHGALGSSGTRANTTIGRALKLVLQNCGGARLAKTESTTLGSPSKLSLCLAEAEEASPRWEPYHVAADGQSAVTLLAATGGPCQLVDFKTTTALSLCEQYAALICPLYSATMPCLNDVLLVVSPEHYATLVGGGVASKTKLKAAVWHLANRELGARIRAPVALAMPGAAGLIVGWVLLVACWCCELAGSLRCCSSPPRGGASSPSSPSPSARRRSSARSTRSTWCQRRPRRPVLRRPARLRDRHRREASVGAHEPPGHKDRRATAAHARCRRRRSAAGVRRGDAAPANL